MSPAVPPDKHGDPLTRASITVTHDPDGAILRRQQMQLAGAALRLCLAAPDRMAAIDALFAHIWEHGRPADSIEALAEVARALGIDDLAAAIARDEVKRELLANGEEAMRLGVFGVPTLKVRDELFWGFDATELALAYRDDEGALDAEMRRVDAIPEAVQRRRPSEQATR